MNIFPRKSKTATDAYYFGEFGEVPLAPFSISTATFDESYEGEPKHYHTKNQKVFLTLEGEGILNVNGKQIVMKPEELIHVEPNEVHFVEKVLKGPLKLVVVLSAKENDKVVLE